MINRIEWTIISVKKGDHTTFSASIPGGTLIRHVEFHTDMLSVAMSFIPTAGMARDEVLAREAALVEALHIYANPQSWTCAAYEYGDRRIEKYRDLFHICDGTSIAKAALEANAKAKDEG